MVALVVAFFGMQMPSLGRHTSVTVNSVPGESYQICDEQAQYLTSPWTYDASLNTSSPDYANGSQSFTVAAYEALPGYGTALPPLPQYIIDEGSTATAAVIFAPGGTVNSPQYAYPETPLLYFFEGGAYTNLGLSAVTGDEFIGGTAPGFPEPTFDDQNNAGGINAQNGTFDFSGGHSTLSATGNIGDTSVSVASTIPGYISWLTFSDGSTYSISNNLGSTVDLGSALTSAEASGGEVWGSQSKPIAYVNTSAAQGGTSVALSSSTVPLQQWGKMRIGDDSYEITGISGTQAGGYTVTVAGLDTAVAANTPVYYDGLAGDVTVSYLDIAHDSHNTTGTIYTGDGWTITHNNIHDGYSLPNGTPTPGQGVAIYGGGQGTTEYNCLSKMGDYGIQADGTNNVFDYNEVYKSNYEPDPGCGCSGGGKWWGTLNADIVNNAFIDDGPGGGGPIWLDNGNTGTLIQGNYFYMSDASSISSETGFDLNVNNNLFVDSGWGSGTGCGGTNCDGAVNINSSGGFNVPGSRYENEVSITNNQFINDWMGIDIWQAGGRNCQNSGEGWPIDATYCTGGFPNSASTSAGGQYYFSHITDAAYGGDQSVAADASAGSSTVLISGSEATDDQIDFHNSSSATTADTTNVTTFAGSGTITVASTTGFPASGQLWVATSNGNAILSYTGTTATTFTGVSLVSDNQVASSGTLTGSVQVNDPAYIKTADTTDVTTLSGSGTITVPSTSGFPTSGQLRVGTSAAWGDGNGSFTGAILAYTGTTATTFTGVSLVRGTGTLAGPIQQVQPYKVTGETCYSNDCSVSITPSLASSVTAGTDVTQAGTCQLFVTAASLPSGPLAPNGTSYWDGCQWQARGITISGNNFVFQPSVIAATKNLAGTTNTCDAASNGCGTNFMQDQYNSGEAPFNDETGVNAMISNSSFTGCPTWDTGCVTDPLTNVNGGTSPPGAPVNNGEAPYNNLWSNNTYQGPWGFNSYIFGNCAGGGVFMPSDTTTGKSMSPTACNVDFSGWKGNYQQDTTSTYNPMVVSLNGLTANQQIHGSSQTISAYEDTASPNTISSTLAVNGANVTTSSVTGSPYSFSLNTLGYHDGSYTLKITGTDSASNTDNDSVTVFISNGDLNGDGKVSLSDLAIMAAHWGQTDSNYADGNISGQSTINLSDLAVMAANWGWVQ